MKKFSKFIANHSGLILSICLLLLIPAIYGYVNTRINYDILVYLPDSVDTIKGENILTDDFGLGAYAFVMVDSTNSKKILDLEKDIKEIKGVNQVVSIADVLDTTIPIDMLPNEVLEKINKDNETIVMVTFDGSTSEDITIEAVRELRTVVKDATKVSSMTSMVIDTMDLSSKEIFAYVVIAVIFCLFILFVATDSYIIPVFLLGNIGVAILYNMGSNIFLGEISYITKAITAILQLGVTMDFSIFLYHKYEQAKENNPNHSKQKAMACAIRETFKSVIGSSLTTFAGFLALCTMDLTLGTDIGVVMAKGVLWGLICVLTLFPSLLIVFDNLIEKTKHKNIFPQFNKLQHFCTKHYKGIIAAFLILMIPAYIGNSNYDVYYKLDESLPQDLAFNVANSRLADKFNIISPEIIILDKKVKTNEVANLVDELKSVEGIDLVLSPSTLIDDTMSELLPNDLKSMLENDKYQLIIVNSTYEIASNELSAQIKEVDKIVKSYDKNSIIAGEGPLMDDLVTIADHDFKMVNYTSIIVIFIIMIFVLKQISLPIILVITIEFAIFVNMAIAYFTNVSLPFIASIVVGTIQLGATIDYAILMSTKYLEERKIISNKKEAILKTLSLTVPSIITSALCFFAATFGVAVYTKIDMIGAICELLARGSIISMIVVVTILPSLLIISDSIIFKKKEGKKMKKINKAAAGFLIATMMISPLNANASTKTETVYSHLDYKGNINQTTINNHLIVNDTKEVVDNTTLTNILNLNGDENFTLEGNKLTWQGAGKDIFYQGKSEKALPINVLVKYYLDGKEVEDVKSIVGASGAIKIELKFLNNSLVRTDNLYIPYVVAVGTMIDSANNKNISISNGKAIDTGSRAIAVALSAPGLYESLKLNELKDLNKVTITYDTTDFKLNEIYMVASPKLLEDADFNIFNKLDQLSSSINLLSENMDLIENGAKELESGSLKLVDGSKEISQNLKTVASSIKKLQNGSVSINDGLNEVNQALQMAISSLDSNKISYLFNTNKQTINTLDESNKNLSQNYNQYGLNNFQTSQEVIAYFSNLGLDDITINELVKCKVMYENIYQSNEQLKSLLEGNNAAISGLIELSSKLPSLLEGINNLSEGSKTITSSLKVLYTGTSKLYNGSEDLSEGTVVLNNGVNTLSAGITRLNKEGIKSLVTYTDKISGYSTKAKKLIKLSKDYNGFTSDNATSTTFIYKIDAVK